MPTAATKRKSKPAKGVDFDNMTPKQLIAHFGETKSAAIRCLRVAGYETAQIARMLGIIYQHARNVLNRPLKRAPKATATPAKTK